MAALIKLTKLNQKEFYLNCELIETVEATPNTVVTLRNGKLYIVEEAPETIAKLVLSYKKGIFTE